MMKTIATIAAWFLLSATSKAYDLRECAGQKLMGGVRSSPETWLFHEDAALYSGTNRLYTAAEVDAHTNDVDVVADAAARDNARLAPMEVPRIAYTNGWSEGIEPDGSTTIWRHRNSPYDPATDAAQYTQAKVSNDTARVEFTALVAGVKQSRSNLTAIALTGFTTAQSNQLRNVVNKTDALGQDVLKLERWIRQNIIKDNTPEAP